MVHHSRVHCILLQLPLPSLVHVHCTWICCIGLCHWSSCHCVHFCCHCVHFYWFGAFISVVFFHLTTVYFTWVYMQLGDSFLVVLTFLKLFWLLELLEFLVALKHLIWFTCMVTCVLNITWCFCFTTEPYSCLCHWESVVFLNAHISCLTLAYVLLCPVLCILTVVLWFTLRLWVFLHHVEFGVVVWTCCCYTHTRSTCSLCALYRVTLECVALFH